MNGVVAEPMNTRAAQVASTVRRTVQELLVRGLNDPRIRGLISVTKVQVTDDLVEAHVFLSVMPEEAEDLTMHGIRHATGHIQTQVGKLLRMRRAPRLSFRIDDSLKRQASLDATLAHVRQELEETDSRRGETDLGDAPHHSTHHPAATSGDSQQGAGS